MRPRTFDVSFGNLQGVRRHRGPGQRRRVGHLARRQPALAAPGRGQRRRRCSVLGERLPRRRLRRRRRLHLQHRRVVPRHRDRARRDAQREDARLGRRHDVHPGQRRQRGPARRQRVPPALAAPGQLRADRSEHGCHHERRRLHARLHGHRDDADAADPGHVDDRRPEVRTERRHRRRGDAHLGRDTTHLQRLRRRRAAVQVLARRRRQAGGVADRLDSPRSTCRWPAPRKTAGIGSSSAPSRPAGSSGRRASRSSNSTRRHRRCIGAGRLRGLRQPDRRRARHLHVLGDRQPAGPGRRRPARPCPARCSRTAPTPRS